MFKKILFLSLLISLKVGANKDIIVQILTPSFGKISYENIQNTPLKGIYEVIINQKLESILISENGRYVIQGKILDLITGEKMPSVADKKRKILNQTTLNNINNKDKIIFKAKNEKYAVNVFTDVDCPFCKKLHKEVPKLNQLGISVKYLASPLAQLHPNAQGIMEKIWCSKDKIKAMDEYKKYETIPNSKTCDNPVAAQLAIGKRLGVRGTPAVFLPDGTHIPGYLSAERLLKKLENTN